MHPSWKDFSTSSLRADGAPLEPAIGNLQFKRMESAQWMAITEMMERRGVAPFGIRNGMTESLATNESAIDFDALAARCLGDASLVSRVLAKFTKQLDEDLGNLARSLRNHNLVEAAETAHRIKGSTGSVEAMRLHRSAGEMEEYAIAGRIEEAMHVFVQMQMELAEAVTEINRKTHSVALGAPHP